MSPAANSSAFGTDLNIVGFIVSSSGLRFVFDFRSSLGETRLRNYAAIAAPV
jgi:hypothetical protein